MNASQSYESVIESRYFSKRGTRTIEGSTVISEQPTIKERDLGMFAIKSKQGMYLTHSNDWCMCYDVDKIKWYKHYLEAEESINGSNDKVVCGLVVFKEAIALKDTRIRQLGDDNQRLHHRYPDDRAMGLAHTEHHHEEDHS